MVVTKILDAVGVASAYLEGDRSVLEQAQKAATRAVSDSHKTKADGLTLLRAEVSRSEGKGSALNMSKLESARIQAQFDRLLTEVRGLLPAEPQKVKAARERIAMVPSQTEGAVRTRAVENGDDQELLAILDERKRLQMMLEEDRRQRLGQRLQEFARDIDSVPHPSELVQPPEKLLRDLWTKLHPHRPLSEQETPPTESAPVSDAGETATPLTEQIESAPVSSEGETTAQDSARATQTRSENANIDEVKIATEMGVPLELAKALKDAPNIFSSDTDNKIEALEQKLRETRVQELEAATIRSTHEEDTALINKYDTGIKPVSTLVEDAVAKIQANKKDYEGELSTAIEKQKTAVETKANEALLKPIGDAWVKEQVEVRSRQKGGHTPLEIQGGKAKKRRGDDTERAPVSPNNVLLPVELQEITLGSLISGRENAQTAVETSKAVTSLSGLIIRAQRDLNRLEAIREAIADRKKLGDSQKRQLTDECNRIGRNLEAERERVLVAVRNWANIGVYIEIAGEVAQETKTSAGLADVAPSKTVPFPHIDELDVEMDLAGEEVAIEALEGQLSATATEAERKLEEERSKKEETKRKSLSENVKGCGCSPIGLFVRSATSLKNWAEGVTNKVRDKEQGREEQEKLPPPSKAQHNLDDLSREIDKAGRMELWGIYDKLQPGEQSQLKDRVRVKLQAFYEAASDRGMTIREWRIGVRPKGYVEPQVVIEKLRQITLTEDGLIKWDDKASTYISYIEAETDRTRLESEVLNQQTIQEILRCSTELSSLVDSFINTWEPFAQFLHIMPQERQIEAYTPQEAYEHIQFLLNDNAALLEQPNISAQEVLDAVKDVYTRQNLPDLTVFNMTEWIQNFIESALQHAKSKKSEKGEPHPKPDEIKGYIQLVLNKVEEYASEATDAEGDFVSFMSNTIDNIPYVPVVTELLTWYGEGAEAVMAILGWGEKYQDKKTFAERLPDIASHIAQSIVAQLKGFGEVLLMAEGVGGIEAATAVRGTQLAKLVGAGIDGFENRLVDHLRQKDDTTITEMIKDNTKDHLLTSLFKYSPSTRAHVARSLAQQGQVELHTLYEKLEKKAEQSMPEPLRKLRDRLADIERNEHEERDQLKARYKEDTDLKRNASSELSEADIEGYPYRVEVAKKDDVIFGKTDKVDKSIQFAGHTLRALSSGGTSTVWADDENMYVIKFAAKDRKSSIEAILDDPGSLTEAREYFRISPENRSMLATIKRIGFVHLQDTNEYIPYILTEKLDPATERDTSMIGGLSTTARNLLGYDRLTGYTGNPLDDFDGLHQWGFDSNKTPKLLDLDCWGLKYQREQVEAKYATEKQAVILADPVLNLLGNELNPHRIQMYCNGDVDGFISDLETTELGLRSANSFKAADEMKAKIEAVRQALYPPQVEATSISLEHDPYFNAPEEYDKIGEEKNITGWVEGSPIPGESDPTEILSDENGLHINMSIFATDGGTTFANIACRVNDFDYEDVDYEKKFHETNTHEITFSVRDGVFQVKAKAQETGENTYSFRMVAYKKSELPQAPGDETKSQTPQELLNGKRWDELIALATNPAPERAGEAETATSLLVGLPPREEGRAKLFLKLMEYPPPSRWEEIVHLISSSELPVNRGADLSSLVIGAKYTAVAQEAFNQMVESQSFNDMWIIALFVTEERIQIRTEALGYIQRNNRLLQELSTQLKDHSFGQAKINLDGIFTIYPDTDQYFNIIRQLSEEAPDARVKDVAQKEFEARRGYREIYDIVNGQYTLAGENRAQIEAILRERKWQIESPETQVYITGALEFAARRIVPTSSVS